jgi:hypothetical protein
MTKLNLIGICGWPGAGKDEVAQTLQASFGYRVVDDGACLRNAAPSLFGFDPSLPFTRQGKGEFVDTPSGSKTVRDILGTLGNLVEAEYGSHFMPFMAVRSAKLDNAQTGHNNFVFPSVRKSQGQFYKDQGGIIIQVSRPGLEPSSHQFDKWDAANVDVFIENDGSLEDLARSVGIVVHNLSLVKDYWLHMRGDNTLELVERT